MFEIRVGYQGPTDACLVLAPFDDRPSKEYLISSGAWHILDFFYNRPNIGIRDELLENVYQNFDADMTQWNRFRVVDDV